MSVLADLVVLAHVVIIVFVLLGGLLAFRWRWIPVVHQDATRLVETRAGQVVGSHVTDRDAQPRAARHQRRQVDDRL